jgi:hypothetical protein
MTNHPASLRSFLLSVLCCDHPDLDGIDRALLAMLAANANMATGVNARPGNAMLERSSGLGRSAMQTRLAKNIERGLIERTQKGDGRGLASVYRLCIDSPYYPDQAPNGEWLIAKKPSGPDRTDCTTKPSGGTAETVRPDTGNRPVEQQKPYGQIPETVRSGPVDNRFSSLSQQEKNHPPNQAASEKPSGGVEAPLKTAPMAHSDIAMDDESEAVRSYEKFHWQRFMKNLPDVLQGATMQKGQRAEIEKLVAKHGADLLLAIITRWLEVRDMPLEGRRANKWGALLEEIEPHIYAVKKESRSKKKSAIDWAATDAEIMRLAKEEQDARDARAVKFGNAGSNSGSVLDNL